ncbi:MAG: Nif3-like dinuclear metal center hexameric protein, partial [Armatimonadota bacterium]
MKLSEIIRILEDIAPTEFAYANDRIGLQAGDPSQETRRITVTVDATSKVIAEAAKMNMNLIIAHHPLIYNPLTDVRADRYPQSLIYRMIKSGISYYVMHTNYDAADGGINDALAERLGVFDTKTLITTHIDKLYKIAVFVPGDTVESVRSALADAGAGMIGNYSHCSFQTDGIGSFVPEDGASPYIGAVGEVESTDEVRLEMLVKESVLKSAISAMIKAHPYETPAYDVYPLWNNGEQHGYGLCGRLKTPMSFDGFHEMVRDVLDVEETRAVGDPDAMLERVALMGGGGGGEIEIAKSAGADVYVTGD